jgi:hypothetical protein
MTNCVGRRRFPSTTSLSFRVLRSLSLRVLRSALPLLMFRVVDDDPITRPFTARLGTWGFEGHSAEPRRRMIQLSQPRCSSIAGWADIDGAEAGNTRFDAITNLHPALLREATVGLLSQHPAPSRDRRRI